MSELIIIGYDGAQPAHRAHDQVLELERGFVLTLNGIAVVRVDHDGGTTVEVRTPGVGVSDAGGAVWGAVLGILFLMPSVGPQLGGAVGAMLRQTSQSGINDEFKTRVHGMLRPGRAVVVLMAAKIIEHQFIAGIERFGGTLLQISLAAEVETELAGVPGAW